MIKQIIVKDSEYNGEIIKTYSWLNDDLFIVERKKKDGRLIDTHYHSRSDGKSHRIDGPAKVYYHYNHTSTIFVVEHYFLKGDYIGSGREGFWALWDLSDDEGKSSKNMLNLLAKYS
jgi:hypothetical protein